MKNKIIVFGVVLFMLSSSFLFSGISFTSNKRIHQHLEEQVKRTCDHSKNVFCTHLPIIEIDTDKQLEEIEKKGKNNSQYLRDNKVMGKIYTFESQTTYNHLEDVPYSSRLGMIGYRGSTSIHFDKKSYKINFINEDFSENRDGELLSMPAHDEWILNGPFLDKTLLRNYIGMNIAGEIMSDTPEVRFCELVVDGEYKGIYVAMENIARGEERINISSYKGDKPFSSYILRQDRDLDGQKEINNFGKYSKKMAENTVVEIFYPKESIENKALETFIKKDFSEFEKAIYSFDYDDDKYGYKKLINTHSFIDYFVINEFFKNSDAGIFSTYFYKDIRGKIHIGPVWDFNNAWDNYMKNKSDAFGFEMVRYPRYEMLIKDEAFVEAVISRYESLRKGVLSEAYLMNYIDETVAFLGDAIERNNAVWGYSFEPNNLNYYNKLHPIERNIGSYEEGILQLKTFIKKRGEWMDEHIGHLKQYAHESVNKEFNH